MASQREWGILNNVYLDGYIKIWVGVYYAGVKCYGNLNKLSSM